MPYEDLPKVVQKFIMQLEAQLAERGVTFELTDQAVAWIAKKGFDEQMGARPLGRVIQEYIKKPLADEVLFGKLKSGGTVKVTLAKDKAGLESLNLEAIPDKPVKPKKTRTSAKSKPKTPAKKASASKEKPEGKRRGGTGSVPKVPLKN